MKMVEVLIALFEQLVGMGSYEFRRHDLLLSELQAYYEPNDQSYSSDQNLYLGRKLPVIVYTKRAYRQPDVKGTSGRFPNAFFPPRPPK